jgi:hypothetical protein
MELKKKRLLKNEKAYEKAWETFQNNYESWPVMRRKMAASKRKNSK